MNVYVVTVATENIGYFNILKESCKRYNFELIVLGFGEKWGGFTWKFLKTREQLNKFNDNDIVIFVDGYDTIILSDKNYIIDKFLSLKTNILVSIEGKDLERNFILQYMHHKKFVGKCKNNNLNSGLYMGYVGYLKQFLDILCSNKRCKSSTADDQRLMVQLCNSKNGFDKQVFFDENVKLDSDVEIFYNYNVGDPDGFKKSKIVHVQKDPNNSSGILINTKTGNRIGIISGPGNKDLSGIIKLYAFEEIFFPRNIYISAANRVLIYSRYFYLDMLIIVFFILLINLIVVLITEKKKS